MGKADLRIVFFEICVQSIDWWESNFIQFQINYIEMREAEQN